MTDRRAVWRFEQRSGTGVMWVTSPSDEAALGAAVARDLGEDPSRWHVPQGYPGLALCVLDSIYSTGNRYGSVLRMLGRYEAERAAEGADARLDAPAELEDASRRWGGTNGFVARTGYQWRAWSRHDAPYKAQVALQAAELLTKHGLSTVEQVRAKLKGPAAQESSGMKREWLRLPGQRSGITWNYFLMLAGVPGVKADRMVVGYVSRALGRPVGPTDAATTMAAVADKLHVSRTVLDHAVWRLESGRPVFVEDGPDVAAADPPA